MDIVVSEGATIANINASLALGSKITGTVTDGSSNLENIGVEAYRWNGAGWDWVWSASADADGPNRDRPSLCPARGSLPDLVGCRADEM